MTFSYLSGSHGATAKYYYTQKQNHALHITGLIVILVLCVSAFSLRVMAQVQSSVSAGGPKFTPIQPLQAPAIVNANVAEDVPQPEPSRIQAAMIQPTMEQWIAGQQQSTWGVALKEIGEQHTANVDQDRVFQAASIYKIYLMPLLHERNAYNTWDTRVIAGRSMKDCVTRMISISDNPCAESLLLSLTTRAVHQNLATMYPSTSFVDGLNIKTSAHDTTMLMEDIYTNDLYKESRPQLMSALGTPKAREGIRRGCTDCEVFNKTGDYGNVLHDTAIIKKNGKTYALAIMSENGTWQQITELTSVITDKL